jgi:hypothetical protein
VFVIGDCTEGIETFVVVSVPYVGDRAVADKREAKVGAVVMWRTWVFGLDYTVCYVLRMYQEFGQVIPIPGPCVDRGNVD